MAAHQLLFHERAFDKGYLPPGSNVMTFFTGDGPPSAERVTKKSEAEAIEWLLRNPSARSLIFEDFGVPPNSYAQASVVEPLLEPRPSRKPGDIDLILVPFAALPDKAIVFQVKRVKVEATSTEKDKVSNRHIGNLTDVVQQANGSRELGFHKNYVLVITEVDGVERTELNFASRLTTKTTLNRIYHQVMDSPPHPDVGIAFIEISQPTRASVDESATLALCIDRYARPVDQPPALTARVRQLMAAIASL